MRAAISSLDGVLINQHFGRAQWFYIVELDSEGRSALVERRAVTPLCQGGSHAEGAAACLEALRDCVAVLTAKIGPGARQMLEAAGFEVFEKPATIEGALKDLAEHYKK